MKEMKIHVGVCTIVNINLSKVDFTGIKELVLTVKNSPSVSSPVIIERRYTEAKKYTEMITAEESVKLTKSAVYDFNKIMDDGTRLRYSPLGKVVLEEGAGDCID